MENKTITIRDVAALAGVGKSTAARALSNKGLVAKETRDRILDAAKKLNYKPNVVFSIMASHRSSSDNKANLIPIALLHGEKEVNIENKLMAGLDKFGFYLEKIYVPENYSKVKLENQLYDLGIVGIILYSVDLALLEQIDFSSYSVISLHRGEEAEQKFNSVRPDRFNDVMKAWKKAMDFGHKRIGAAIGRQYISSYDDGLRYGAVCECQELWKDRIEIIPPYLGPVNDLRQYLKWYFKYKPTCVIGFQVHFYWALRDMNLKIPEDISFITLVRTITDDIFSGLDNSDDETIMTCLSQLDQLIRNRTRGLPEFPVSIYVSSNWHRGTTLGRV